MAGNSPAAISSQEATRYLDNDTLASTAALRVRVDGTTAYLAGQADSQTEVTSARTTLLELAGIERVVDLVSVD